MREWLWVGKPLREPFRDGSTVLVRDLAAHLPPEFEVTYFGDPARPVRLRSGHVLGAGSMGYAPGLQEKGRMLGPLLSWRHRHKGVHFFFTPNRVTSRVVDAVRRLRSRPVVQTVMSAHGVERYAGLLGNLDALVVLSEQARERLMSGGVRPDRIHRIYPGVEISEVEPGERFSVLYAGDLDEAVARRLVEVAVALPPPYRLCIAARPKGGGDADARAWLRRALGSSIREGRVELLSEVSDLRARMEAAALQLFVADHVRRKVDVPLVLLEGLARGVPLVAVDSVPSVTEIFDRAREHDLVVGQRLASHEMARVVAETLADPVRREAWSRDARALARAVFSVEEMVRGHVALYDALG